MIRKLRLKFILLAAAALFVMLSVVVATMNFINYRSVVNESDQILTILSQNKGAFPENYAQPGPDHRGFSPETPHESRYFTVFLSDAGEVLAVDTSRITAVDPKMALEYAMDVSKEKDSSGFVGQYRYIVYDSISGTNISFLDCGRSIDSFTSFLWISMLVSLFGFIAILVVVIIVSGYIVRPIAVAYEKQRQFITDAGHEIKTPLTIINANLDILEMDLDGKNEAVVEIENQTKRLSSLTDELVMLARMEEPGNSLEKIEFPLSDVVAESAHPFYTLASTQGKEFVCNIQPMLTLEGNDKSIRQLVSLLLDNAMKYSPQGGRITLSLEKRNKRVNLVVFNTTTMPVQQEQLRHVFDRFYRADASRNSETGGHGIGLSVAHAIVVAHGGEIVASTNDGMSFLISALFPC